MKHLANPLNTIARVWMDFALLLALGISSATWAQSDITKLESDTQTTLLTTSQQILRRAMEDIYTCDMTGIQYGYNSKTKKLSPPELRKIKGLKLKTLYRELAVFEIDETYEGLQAKVLIVRHLGKNSPFGDFWPSVIAFENEFGEVRLKLEHVWGFQFQDFMNSSAGDKKVRYVEYKFGIDSNGNRVAPSSTDLSFSSLGTRPRALVIEYGTQGVYPHVELSGVKCDAGN